MVQIQTGRMKIRKGLPEPDNPHFTKLKYLITGNYTNTLYLFSDLWITFIPYFSDTTDGCIQGPGYIYTSGANTFYFDVTFPGFEFGGIQIACSGYGCI